MDHRELLHTYRWYEYGRDTLFDSYIRRSLLLGLYVGSSSTRALLRLDHWLVS